MNAELLVKYFDRISEAPNAIPRLRKFILDLAVRGKLVEQDPNDDSSSQLLHRIHAWRKEAEGAKNIRAPRKPLQAVGETDLPYSLPSGWEWARLGELIYIHSGDVLTAEAMRNGCIPVFGGNGIAGYHDTPNIFRPSIVIGRVGYYCGSIHVTPAQAWVTDNAFVTEFPADEILQAFLVLLLTATNLKENEKATAQPVISGAKIYPIVVGLPPLAEQQRIVAKVDELMALCDRLEAVRGERESRRDRLTAASHHHLNQGAKGANAEGFRKHSLFCLNHLSRLTTRPEQIPSLRRTILSLAIRGQLVPQNSSDEPASEALKRIQVDKARLTEAGKIKKDKKAWEGLPKDPPHELPVTWVWTRLQDVFEISRGGSPRPAGDPRYFGGPIPWITVREITKDGEKYLTSTESGLTEEGATRSRFIEPGDLLLTNSGATLGVPKISCIKACMNDGVAVLRQFHSVPLNDFAYLYLHSQTDAFRRVNQGMGQPNLNTPIIAGWFFPLPPLAEQRRIIARVDELMALCDRLEAQLTTAQTGASRLLESVLHNALSGDTPPKELRRSAALS